MWVQNFVGSMHWCLLISPYRTHEIKSCVQPKIRLSMHSLCIMKPSATLQNQQKGHILSVFESYPP